MGSRRIEGAKSQVPAASGRMRSNDNPVSNLRSNIYFGGVKRICADPGVNAVGSLSGRMGSRIPRGAPAGRAHGATILNQLGARA